MSSLNCSHDFKVGGVEEDRLEVEVVDPLEVGGMGAADGLGVIRWREGEEGRWMARLENTGILSEGLSFTDPHWLGCVIQQWATFTFINSSWQYQLNLSTLSDSEKLRQFKEHTDKT